MTVSQAPMLLRPSIPTRHRRLLTVLLAAATVVLLGAASTALLSSLRISPLVVVSGSMEPSLPIGTIVYSQAVDAEAVEVGDVVTTDRFNGPGTVTHRVVSIERSPEGSAVLTLKGDANAGVDRETYEVDEVGVARVALPYAGLPQLWIQGVLGIDPLAG
ncbi:signal peptidase I [Microbacterium karelineae]|uniref:signal peptidase I n=1 Tax=Microbacterium karelineae TaxID=2654283 RepID=UPI001E648DBE|nr:signal peptidase I [Microbacterium karelineae]